MNDSKTGNILGKDVAGVNCILPHKHKTAWDLFLKGCANNWMPTEISMADDIKQWKNGEITDDEKLLVKRSLGFFAFCCCPVPLLFALVSLSLVLGVLSFFHCTCLLGLLFQNLRAWFCCVLL